MTLKLIFKLQNLQRVLLDRYITAKSKEICAINSTINMLINSTINMLIDKMLIDKRADVATALADAYDMKGKM